MAILVFTGLIIASIVLVAGAILLRAEGAQEALQPENSTPVEKSVDAERVEFARPPAVAVQPFAVIKTVKNRLPELVLCTSREGRQFTGEVLRLVEGETEKWGLLRKRGHRNAHPFWRKLVA